MDLGLNGRTALITGGASGIGKATATRLADEGVHVILCDLKGDAVSDAVNEIGKGTNGLQADLTKPDQVRGLFETVRERFALPDILINAAGITGAKGHPLKMSDNDWHEAWETDFMSAVRMMRHFVPPMCEKGWGRAIVLCSENVAQPYPEEAVYNAAKAALLNYSKSLSMAVAGDGVLVNAVSPAFIETPMTDGMMEKRSEEKGVDFDEAVEGFLEEKRPYLALKRRGRPQEVADVIAFLCSENASFVSGSNYRVDGGAVASMGL